MNLLRTFLLLLFLSLHAGLATAQPFDQSDWSVRAWNPQEKRWTERGIDAMTIVAAEDVTRITNTTGIHRHAHLVYRAKLEGDFSFSIELKGGYELGFLNREGKDEMLYVELADGQAFETFDLSRNGTRFTIQRNGRVVPMVHFRFDYGDEVQITLAIQDGKSAEIRSYALDAGTASE